MPRSLERVAAHLRRAYEVSGSWGQVAKAFGISKGEAFKIALRHHEPKDPEIRRRLELAEDRCPSCHRKLKLQRRQYVPTLRPMHWWRYVLSARRRQEYIMSTWEREGKP